MKTCPTCGNNKAQVLIVNVQTGERFCHQCAETACPAFMPGLVYSLEDVRFLHDCAIDPEIANIEARVPTGTTQLVLDDLMFLREAHIRIDDETFTSVLRHENLHRDFGSCSDCGVTTFSQHDRMCRRASVLWLPNWFEIVQARDRNSRPH